MASLKNASLFSTEDQIDLSVLVWAVVFVLWTWATLGNLFDGNYQLADIPAGLAAAVAALPVAKGVATGLRRFGGK